MYRPRRLTYDRLVGLSTGCAQCTDTEWTPVTNSAKRSATKQYTSTQMLHCRPTKLFAVQIIIGSLELSHRHAGTVQYHCSDGGVILLARSIHDGPRSVSSKPIVTTCCCCCCCCRQSGVGFVLILSSSIPRSRLPARNGPRASGVNSFIVVWLPGLSLRATQIVALTWRHAN